MVPVLELQVIERDFFIPEELFDRDVLPTVQQLVVVVVRDDLASQSVAGPELRLLEHPQHIPELLILLLVKESKEVTMNNIHERERERVCENVRYGILSGLKRLCTKG